MVNKTIHCHTWYHIAGLRVDGCVADLADASSRKQLVERVRAQFGGKLNILGNCPPLLYETCVPDQIRSLFCNIFIHLID